MLLDFDATDDPTHGEQEGSYYHGYYEQHMYHPLLVFDGETGHLITALLRAGNTHGSRSAVALLKRICARLRNRWPEVEVELRADAGFAVPALYEYCEEEGIAYTVGLVTNPRLEEMARDLLAEAEESHEARGEKVRLFAEGPYRAGSWERPRRVAYKAEAMEKGTNTRFFVTTREEEPEDLYGFYARRGRARTGSRTQAAHEGRSPQLPSVRREPVQATVTRGGLLADGCPEEEAGRRGARRMQLDSLRLRLIKIGGRVRELLTKVRLHLASGHPGQEPVARSLGSFPNRS